MTFRDLSRRLEELHKAKLCLVAEIDRLYQRRAHLETQYLCDQTISHNVNEISAVSYSNQAPVDYVQDRYGKSHEILHTPGSLKLYLLDQLLQEDNLQAFNGYYPNNLSNVSGLGGIHKPKYGFGSRLYSTKNISRFKEELQNPVLQELTLKNDFDEQYYRVNFTYMTNKLTNMSYVISAKKPRESGIVPLNRIVYEEPIKNLKIVQENILLDASQSYYMFDSIKFDLDDYAFQNAAERQNIKQYVLYKRAAVKYQKSLENFYKDLEYVKYFNKTANVYYLESEQNNFASTPGFYYASSMFNRLKKLFHKGVSNYGKWDFKMPYYDQLQIDPIKWYRFLLFPGPKK